LVEGRKGGLEFFLPSAGRGFIGSSLSPESTERRPKELALRHYTFVGCKLLDALILK